MPFNDDKDLIQEIGYVSDSERQIELSKALEVYGIPYKVTFRSGKRTFYTDRENYFQAKQILEKLFGKSVYRR